MPIAFRCSSCSGKLRVPDQLAGRLGKCLHCGLANRVPSASQASDHGELTPMETDEHELANTLAPPADAGASEPELAEEQAEVDRLRLRLEAARLELERAEIEQKLAAGSLATAEKKPKRARISQRVAPERKGANPFVWALVGLTVAAGGAAAFHFLRPRTTVERVVDAIGTAVEQRAAERQAEMEAVRTDKNYLAKTIRLFQEMRGRTVLSELWASGDRADAEREMRDRGAKVEIALAEVMDLMPEIPQSVAAAGRAKQRAGDAIYGVRQWAVMIRPAGDGDRVLLEEMSARLSNRLRAIDDHIDRVATALARKETDRTIGG